MGNRVVVKLHNPGTDLVSIRPVRKNARPHFMGSVMLDTVNVLTDSLEGDLLEEWEETRELPTASLKLLTRIFPTDKGWVRLKGKGKFEPVTGEAKAAYLCGSEVYVRL